MPVPPPKALLAANGRWPVGPWRTGLPPAERLAATRVAEISATIRAERSRRGETQAELAEAAGVALTTVNRIETGRVWPDVRTVWLLLGALDVTEWPRS